MLSTWKMWRTFVGLSVLFGWGMVACVDQTVPWTETGQGETRVHRLPIIGGNPDVRYPEVGALTANQSSFCTGTLIARRVVLTAAHCVDAALSYGSASVQFRIDVPDASKTDGYEAKYFDFDKKLFQNHPKWNTNLSNGGDVGVGILAQKVTVVTPMPASFVPMDSSWVGRKPLFLGYGLIQSVPTSVSPRRKYSAEIPIVSVIADRFTHQDSNKSVCHGDSGGPAVFLINGRMRVLGVNSYVNAPRVPGTTRSTCTGTGTSMRTDTHASFIQSVLNTYGDGPETCASNDECGQCAQCDTNKKICEPLPIAALTQTCGPCRSDKDCGGGKCYRFPDGYRCLQPCSAQSCCPDNHYCSPLQTESGLSQLCMPFSNTCPVLNCQKDEQCGPGEFCENGFCLPQAVARHPELCKPCRETTDCSTHLCEGLPGQKRCSQSCGIGDFCPPDYSCAQPYPGVAKQCVPQGGACQVPCMFHSNCSDGEICVKGICSVKEGGDYGSACDPGGCKSPLVCTTTISGRRCLQPCNHPDGFAGSSCINGSQCNAGLQCFALSSELRTCLGTCQTTADCAKYGGGQCSSGICFCFQNGHCASGNVCNVNNDQFGACAPADSNRGCDKTAVCRHFDGRSFCVEPGVGSRSLGQSCDPLNRCREGLACMSTTDGSICFEDCAKTGTCSSGGTCTGLEGGLRICLCQGTIECAKNRICRPYVQQGLSQFGLCEAQGLNNPCVGSQECPPDYQCIRGTCLTGKDLENIVPDEPEAQQEPTSSELVTESSGETVSEDGGGTLQEQSTAEPQSDGNSSVESGHVDNLAETSPETPGKGCGCESVASAPPWSSLLWFSVLFVVVGMRRFLGRIV